MKSLQLLREIARFVFARVAVVAAIVLAVDSGGLSHESFSVIMATLAWLAIWAAIEYYRWHVNRFG